MIVLGIDPGGRHVGVVVRDGKRLLAHDVLTVRSIRAADALEELCWEVWRVANDVIDDIPPDLIAIEGLVPPSGWIGGRRSNVLPADLIGVAAVYGALLAGIPLVYRALDEPGKPVAIVVPPGNHGSGMLGGYPDALISPAERRHGVNRTAPQSSDIRHARSAWDVAGVAVGMAKAGCEWAELKG